MIKPQRDPRREQETKGAGDEDTGPKRRNMVSSFVPLVRVYFIFLLFLLLKRTFRRVSYQLHLRTPGTGPKRAVASSRVTTTPSLAPNASRRVFPPCPCPQDVSRHVSSPRQNHSQAA